MSQREPLQYVRYTVLSIFSWTIGMVIYRNVKHERLFLWDVEEILIKILQSWQNGSINIDGSEWTFHIGMQPKECKQRTVSLSDVPNWGTMEEKQSSVNELFYIIRTSCALCKLIRHYYMYRILLGKKNQQSYFITATLNHWWLSSTIGQIKKLW